LATDSHTDVTSGIPNMTRTKDSGTPSMDWLVWSYCLNPLAITAVYAELNYSVTHNPLTLISYDDWLMSSVQYLSTWCT